MMTFGKPHFCKTLMFIFVLAGSAGDPYAPQFIVENRAVILEYAREKTPSTYEPKGASGAAGAAASAAGSGADKKASFRSDWMCTKVMSCHFVRSVNKISFL